MTPWRPAPYYVAECTAVPDQGVVEAWISRRGRPLLSCDVCHATWYDPRDLDPSAADVTESDAPERPATRAELEALGWWELVHPLSRAAHGESPDRPARLAPGTWGQPHPAPYWTAECGMGDQGLIVAWVTWAGRLLVFCDVCFRTWPDPRERDPDSAEVLPASGTWPDDDRLRRPAGRQELERAGWWQLVDPRSRRARGEEA